MAHNSFRNEAGFPLAPAGSTDASVVAGPVPGLLVPRIGDEADLLPAQGADRLRELRQRRDDARILIKAAHEEWQDLHVEIERHRQRLRQLRGPRGLDCYDLPEDDLGVVSEQERLDKKIVELKRRSELSELRGGRARILAALVTAAEDWIRNKPVGTVIAMHPPIDPDLKKGEDLLIGIERYRRRGRELEADLHRIRSSPWPSSGARQKAQTLDDQLAESGRPLVENAIDHNEPIPFPTRTYQVRIFNADPSAVGFVEIPDPVALIAWLLPDALSAALNHEIDAAADDHNAMTAEQRRDAEKEVLSDLLAAARCEAALVWRAQSEGATILQRPEIDPRALLGVELAPAPPRVPRDDDGQFGIIRHVGP